MSNPVWKPILSPSRSQWKRNPVECCYLGRVCFVLRQRNSYNWSQSSNYFGASAFYPNRRMAKDYLERNRERGSAWTIDEHPGLVIAGRDYAVCITGAGNYMDCFSCFEGLDLKHKTIKRIIEDVWAYKSDRIFMYLTEVTAVSALDRPLHRYASHSFGGQYRLSWRQRGKSPVVLKGVIGLQKAVWDVICSEW